MREVIKRLWFIRLGASMMGLVNIPFSLFWFWRDIIHIDCDRLSCEILELIPRQVFLNVVIAVLLFPIVMPRFRALFFVVIILRLSNSLYFRLFWRQIGSNLSIPLTFSRDIARRDLLIAFEGFIRMIWSMRAIWGTRYSTRSELVSS